MAESKADGLPVIILYSSDTSATPIVQSLALRRILLVVLMFCLLNEENVDLRSGVKRNISVELSFSFLVCKWAGLFKVVMSTGI